MDNCLNFDDNENALLFRIPIKFSKNLFKISEDCNALSVKNVCSL